MRSNDTWVDAIAACAVGSNFSAYSHSQLTRHIPVYQKTTWLCIIRTDFIKPPITRWHNISLAEYSSVLNILTVYDILSVLAPVNKGTH